MVLMDELSACHYCHQTADTIDHVVPRALIIAATDSGDAALIAAVSERRRRMTVTSCRECNHLAGAVYDQTLALRRARIADKFERRHRRVLEMPDWSDTELMELSPQLRGYVINAVVKRDELRERLRWLKR